MSVRALSRRAAALYADECVRWREAWGAFWARVAAEEPEAADALDAFHAAANDAELDALADGSAPVLGEATDALARWGTELDAELGEDPDAEAWEVWLTETCDWLPRSPDPEVEPAALHLWPQTVPPSPPFNAERLEVERAFMLARLAEARAAGSVAETLAASITLERFGVIVVLGEVRSGPSFS